MKPRLERAQRKVGSRPLRGNRRPVLDAMRGLAVLAMILFHFSWDWSYEIRQLSSWPDWYWHLVPDIIGSTFFFVAGISQALSPKDPFREGAKVFGWGMLLTLVSLVYSPAGPIVFGVLHSLGVSKALARPFSKRRDPGNAWLAATATLALTVLVAGYGLRHFGFHSVWSYVFMWVGFRPNPIPAMADYYPILPDIGYLLLGIVCARLIYPVTHAAPKRRAHAAVVPTEAAAAPVMSPLIWLGRRSLVVYIVHQPVLFGLTALIRWTSSR